MKEFNSLLNHRELNVASQVVHNHIYAIVTQWVLNLTIATLYMFKATTFSFLFFPFFFFSGQSNYLLIRNMSTS